MKKSSSDDTHDIGTELLRTLVAVVEERSYTRAAHRLGLSQPTVSAHIRRLQEQIGFELFDKRVPGVQLNAQGEIALTRARQILALHESLIRGSETATVDHDRIRLGIPNEVRWDLSPILARMRRDNPRLNFRLERDSSPKLLERLHGGHLDICAITQLHELDSEADIRWCETLVWAGLPLKDAPLNPVNIVAPPAGCLCRDIMLDTLEKAELSYRIVVDTDTFSSAISAAAAGLGYIGLLRSNIPASLSVISSSAGLPPMTTPYYWGVYTNPVTRSSITRRIAEFIAARMNVAEPSTVPAEG